MEIITTYDLAADLGDDNVATDSRAVLKVRQVNDLIAEKWRNPVIPAPASVFNLALAMATRAYIATPGRGRPDLITTQFDDSSRTERYAQVGADPNGHDVYLTEAELAVLNGGARTRRIGSIRLQVPGY